MGKSKDRAGKIPKPRVERRKYMDKGAPGLSAAGKSAKVMKKNRTKALKNRRGEDLNSDKAAKLQREGHQRKESMQKTLAVKRCQVRVQQIEEELRAYKEPLTNAEELASAFKEKKQERLYGAWRPWDSREKSTHGCGYDVYECMDHCGDWENDPEPKDLLELHTGEMMAVPPGQPFCQAILDLGDAHRDADNTDEAVAAYQRLLEMDNSDALAGRFRLLSAYMDAGMLGEARALLQDTKLFPESQPRGTRELYSMALIEYIAWSILEEEDASEEVAVAAIKAALEVNPFAAAMVCWNEAFQEVVDPEEDTEALPPEGPKASAEQQVAEALQYCISDIMVWVDADGAPEWLADILAESPEQEAALLAVLEGDDGPKAVQLYRAVQCMDVEMRADDEEEEGGSDGQEDGDDDEGDTLP